MQTVSGEFMRTLVVYTSLDQNLGVHLFLKIRYLQGALENISHSIKDNLLNILLFSPTRHDTERSYKVLLLSSNGKNVPGRGSLQIGLPVRLVAVPGSASEFLHCLGKHHRVTCLALLSYPTQ